MPSCRNQKGATIADFTTKSKILKWAVAIALFICRQRTCKLHFYETIFGWVNAFKRNSEALKVAYHLQTIINYPAHPQLLPQDVYKAAYTDADPPITKELLNFAALGSHIPPRSNSALLTRERAMRGHMPTPMIWPGGASCLPHTTIRSTHPSQQTQFLTCNTLVPLQGAVVHIKVLRVLPLLWLTGLIPRKALVNHPATAAAIIPMASVSLLASTVSRVSVSLWALANLRVSMVVLQVVQRLPLQNHHPLVEGSHLHLQFHLSHHHPENLRFHLQFHLQLAVSQAHLQPALALVSSG